MQFTQINETISTLHQLRREMDALDRLAIQGLGRSRYDSLAKTHYLFGRAWLGKAVGSLAETDPSKPFYSHSYDAQSVFVDVASDTFDKPIPDELKAKLFPGTSFDTGVQRAKQTRVLIAAYYKELGGLRREIAPGFDGASEQGLKPYECLSQALYHLHEASISLGYEIADMLRMGRDGAEAVPVQATPAPEPEPQDLTEGGKLTPPAEAASAEPSGNDLSGTSSPTSTGAESTDLSTDESKLPTPTLESSSSISNLVYDEQWRLSQETAPTLTTSLSLTATESDLAAASSPAASLSDEASVESPTSDASPATESLKKQNSETVSEASDVSSSPEPAASDLTESKPSSETPTPLAKAKAAKKK